MRTTRRSFGQAILGAAGAASAAAAAEAAPRARRTGAAATEGPERRFPPGFTWGCATASYQIEGAVKEDGRGASIWDVFSHTPGKVANGDTGDEACDSYHRYKEDALLLKHMGVGAYRMSVAWPRIFPEGRGKPNQKGVDYYDRVVDNLLKLGIEPHVTMFHWDLPAALPGEWRNRDTAYAFADYAGFMAGRLSDRVKSFMTVNELRCFTDLGHQEGKHAPGLHLGPAERNQVRHHGVLAHGLGVQAIRAHARPGTRVGLADNADVFVPVVDTPDHIEAARKAFREGNAMFLTAVMEGRYPDSYLKGEGAAAPKVADGDMRAIGSPLDFVGINVYSPNYVRADPGSRVGYKVIPHTALSPRMSSDWLYVGPQAAYWAVRHVTDLWKPRAIYITENGCSAEDAVVDGRVDDPDRIMFLRAYVDQLQRATAEGYPLKGYFLWSLMDNFEWSDGYGKRFGLHYVDFATQKRTPKLSAAWYREVIARNAVA